MKTKLLRILTAIMAVIFLCSTGVYAEPQPKLMDTRRAEHGSEMAENQQMPVPKDRNGKEIVRPLAAFEVIRVNDRPKTNGLPNPGYQGKAVSTGFQIDNKQDVATVKVEFPDYTLKEPEDINTLYCYVGETLYFVDCSVPKNNGDKIASWDWQYWGDLWNSDPNNHIYDYNILGKTEFKLTKPGTNHFYLCVKSSTKPHKNSDWAWSVNGSHKSKGENPNYPKGILWYFAEVQVVVQEDILINYIDKDTGMKLGHEYRRIYNTIGKADPLRGKFSVISPRTFKGTEYLYDHSELYNSDGSFYGEAKGMDFTFVDENSNVVPYRRVDVYMGNAEGLRWNFRFINANSGEVLSEKEPIVYNDVDVSMNYTLKCDDGYEYLSHVEKYPDGSEKYFFEPHGKISRMSADIDVYCVPAEADGNNITVTYIDVTDNSVLKTVRVPEGTTYEVEVIPKYKFVYHRVVNPDNTLGPENPEGTFPVADHDVNVYFSPETPVGDGDTHTIKYIDINTREILRSEKVTHGMLYPISPVDGYRFLHYCELNGDVEGEKQTGLTLFVNTDINAYFTSEGSGSSSNKITVKYIDIETDDVLRTDSAEVGEEYDIDSIRGYEYVYYKPVTNGHPGVEHSEDSFTAQKNVDINAYFIKASDGFDGDGECSDTITWTEKESHKGTYRSWSSVKEQYVTRTYNCTHTYKYKAVLTASNNHLTDSVFKAGYGFGNEVTAKVKVTLTSKKKSSSRCKKTLSSSRAPKAEVFVPSSAVIDTGFVVESANRGKQERLVDMEIKSGGGSFSDISTETVVFQNKENPLSVLNKRTVFTPVYIPDGGYSYNIFISNGKVVLEDGTEKELCLTLDGNDAGKYTIKGDMYEDDSTNNRN